MAISAHPLCDLLSPQKLVNDQRLKDRFIAALCITFRSALLHPQLGETSNIQGRSMVGSNEVGHMTQRSQKLVTTVLCMECAHITVQWQVVSLLEFSFLVFWLARKNLRATQQEQRMCDNRQREIVKHKVSVERSLGLPYLHLQKDIKRQILHCNSLQSIYAMAINSELGRNGFRGRKSCLSDEIRVLFSSNRQVVNNSGTAPLFGLPDGDRDFCAQSATGTLLQRDKHLKWEHWDSVVEQ